MLNPNWARWTIMSLTKAFSDAISPSLHLHVPGTDRRTDKLQDYAEFRYCGPFFNELSKDYWQVDVDIDVLIVSKTNDTNIYAGEVDIGVVTAAFVNDIPVFQYGTGLQDDQNIQLGCLRLVPMNGGQYVTNFGSPKEQVRMRQASVEATYRMNLSL